MIYVNGDSHSAGAEIIPGIAFAQDDPRFLAYGRRAHPEAVIETYGYRVSQALNQGFFCEAESGSSNSRILRTTKDFIANTKNKKDIFIIIGWSTWEREEWLDGEDFLQVTSSGTDSVPEHMAEDYKHWILKQTESELDAKTALWHDKIYDFHMELRDMEIKHTFFNTYLYFDEIAVPKQKQKNWHHQFVNPYAENFTLYYFLKEKGIDTVSPKSYHFGLRGHREWAKVILEYSKAQYRDPKKSSCIPNLNRKTVTEQNVQPMVDKKRNF